MSLAERHGSEWYHSDMEALVLISNNFEVRSQRRDLEPVVKHRECLGMGFSINQGFTSCYANVKAFILFLPDFTQRNINSKICIVLRLLIMPLSIRVQNVDELQSYNIHT